MNSRELHDEALQLMPAGVSSPVRSYAPYPRAMRSGRGSRITDVEGRSYLDYCLGYGPLVLGHAHPAVVAAVQARAAQGTLLGAPCEEELELAKLVRRHYPSIASMRFVSTGAEAVMHALRLARGATGREVVVKIDGAFHGAVDGLLARAGSGAEPFGVPTSAGVPAAVARLTAAIPFNDVEAARALFEKRGSEIAAIIVEPVMANVGPIAPEKGYLELLRKLTADHGALLVFDEIVTGFRVGLGGAQEAYDLTPDLTTLGKVLGGGLPLGLLGGKREILERLAPLGPVYQAGTFSGNPLSLAAGIAAIQELERVKLTQAERVAEELRSGLADISEDLGLPTTVAGIGTLFQLFFAPGPVRDAAGARAADSERFLRTFRGLLEHGVYLPPSQFETCFTSNAHSLEDARITLEAVGACLKAA